MVIKKFDYLESAQKIHASRGQCIVHAHQLMGVAIPVSEILLLSKTTKFPFLTMDCSPWSSKNLIIWNRLKIFMQVVVNVLSMHTDFDGCRHSGFGDIATFKNGQISLSDHGLVIIKTFKKGKV